LKDNRDENTIRCQRGKVVLTKGYNLCTYVIHAVGAVYDGGNELFGACSSSRIGLLESCYKEIVKVLKEHPEIKRIAVPIIGAGQYKFPFELAARVAVATMGNELLDWYLKDKEFFEKSKLEKVYFFIYETKRKNNSQINYMECLHKINLEYKKCLDREEKVVVQKSFDAHMSYCKELKEYDKARGYFSVAKRVRIMVMILRFLCLPIQLINDFWAGFNWNRRRTIIEGITIFKPVIVLSFFWIQYSGYLGFTSITEKLVQITICFIVAYFMFDTITYLSNLILMADIQKPSANIIRSIILFFINYIEVSLDMSYICYVCKKGQMSIIQSLYFGILGEYESLECSLHDMGLVLISVGVKFFFLTVAFGYFSGHMKQRKFKS